MGLYDRLLGRDETGAHVTNKILVHQFINILDEVARKSGGGTGMTAGEALVAVNRVAKGGTLSGPEQTEANTLLTTITSQGTPAGKLARSKEIEDVLLLAESIRGPWTGGSGANQYDRPSDVKIRLGV